MQLKVSVNIIVLEKTQKVLVELLLSFMFPFYQHPLVVIMISKINGQMWINDKLEPDKFKKGFSTFQVSRWQRTLQTFSSIL